MKTTFGSYKRVILFGVDGMGAFCRVADTPNMDKVFARGATTMESFSERPTISGQCWSSMLIGAMPEIHRQSNYSMHPNPALPSLFSIIRKAHPDAVLAAFVGWSALTDKLLEKDCGINALVSSPHDDDEEVVSLLEPYLDENDPEFLFVQLDGVDGAGHNFGYGSEPYLKQIHIADECFGRVINKYAEHNRLDDTLVIVSADHGGTMRGSHGAWTPEERHVFLGVAGKNVLHGPIGEVHLRDYPAIVLWALGVEAPAFNRAGYVAQLPVGIFPDAGVKDRIRITEQQKFYAPSPEPERGSPRAIERFIPEKDILFFINFEEGENDVFGKCKTTVESGLIKHYSEGIRGRCGELGNGVLRIDGINHAPVFTIAFWLMVDTTNDEWIDVMTSKDGVHSAFSISAADAGSGVYLKGLKDNGGYDDIWRLQKIGDDGQSESAWMHYMFVIDIPNNCVTAYLNFGGKYSAKPEKYRLSDYLDFHSVRCGVDHSAHAYKMIDDLMMVNGAVDPAVLEKYYSAK